MVTEITSRTGKKYLIKPNKNGGWKVVRSDTRSEVKVSASLIRKTITRLESGEEISFRKIDSTVAKETTVVHVLKDIINIDHVKKTYSLKGSSPKKATYSWEMINRNVVLKYIDTSLYSQGTAVPIELYSFFELDDMDYGEKGEIYFNRGKKLYTCRKQTYQDRTGIRIFWDSDLKKDIKREFKDIFLKLSNDQDSNSKFSKDGYLRFEKKKDNIHISIVSQKAVDNDIESLKIEDGILSKEGKRKAYYGHRYERIGKNRKKAIEIHGTSCFGCGINLEEKYGERGEGFIEVHHIKPLSHQGKEIVIDPEKDLIPLCPNCHRIVHRFPSEILTISQLREIIN
jgi:5-methylcytosine-specific restriction enzyme A